MRQSRRPELYPAAAGRKAAPKTRPSGACSEGRPATKRRACATGLAAEPLVEALEQRRSHHRQLRGPHRRAAGDRDLAVRLGHRGRLGGDLGTGRRGPLLLHAAPAASAGSRRPGGRRALRSADAGRDGAGASGAGRHGVAVGVVGRAAQAASSPFSDGQPRDTPARARRVPTARRCRRSRSGSGRRRRRPRSGSPAARASSSLRTSSSNNSGTSPRLAASASRSASSSDSRPRRCWPCDP